MTTKICIVCDGEFDPHSAEKKRAGGKINHCPDCSEENEPRVLGLSSGDGKMAAINIVKCASIAEAEQLKRYWRKASGLNKGKQCQMHNPGLVMPHVSFEIISKSGSMNHKGKE